MATVTLTSPPKRIASSRKPHPARMHRCPECGHILRVSGLGRHQVYFDLDDERSFEPVMDRACPQCGHGLPAKGLP
jgi:hypothetical protein